MLGACARLEEPCLRWPLRASRLWTHTEHSQLHGHILLLRSIGARICKHVMLHARPPAGNFFTQNPSCRARWGRLKPFQPSSFRSCDFIACLSHMMARSEQGQ